MSNQSSYWAITDISGNDNDSGADLAVIVAGVRIPIAQFSMTYALNDIPTATCLVALGRNARTQEPSAIYGIASQIRQMSVARVEIRGNLGEWSPRGGADGGKQQWPGGVHVLFVGYVSGISYRRSLGRVSLVLNLVNQLVDLSMSSGGSADVVPGAPHDLMLPTLGEGSGGEPIGTASSKFINLLPTDLNVDFSLGVLRALYFVCQENQLQTHSAWCPGLAPPEQVRAELGNTRAAVAIGGSTFWNGIANYAGGPDARYSRPYPLNIHSEGRDHTAQRIGDVIAASLAGTSMWSMMIGSLIPEFGVYIIPIAQTAFMAPIIPMSREPYKIIAANEYADFNLKTMSQRPLYGVGVMGNYSTATMARSESDNKQCVGETFVATAASSPINDGMWMFVPAPRWMDDWANFDPEAIAGNPAVVRMLSEPSHDAAGVDQNAVTRDPDGEVISWNDAMRKYAQMMYASNALRGRDGTIVGKLRFDISPGSTILIRARDEINQVRSAGTDQLATDLYGLVARVTVTINAEQTSAATTLELTNLRTDLENQLNRFSLSSHPFFDDNFFNGAPLVPSLEIIP